MIIHFDSSIIDQSYAHELAAYMKLIHEKKHKVDYDDPEVWSFIEQEVLTSTYLGKLDIDVIKEDQELRDIRNTDRGYYRTVNVGSNKGQIDLKTLGIILSMNSCVVLENSHYDWCPIKIWIDFVKNDRDYKDVNHRVSEAIGLNWIYPEHAGGGAGTITNKIVDIRDSAYYNAAQYKVTTIFDSDKLSTTTPSDKNNGLKEFLDTNGYDYHEWTKREIENYIPLRIYKYTGLVNRNVAEPDTTPANWDYTDIGEHPYFKGKYKKNKLPMLSKNIDKASVKESFADKNYINNVDNHPISELQQVIFHLAKYI